MLWAGGAQASANERRSSITATLPGQGHLTPMNAVAVVTHNPVGAPHFPFGGDSVPKQRALRTSKQWCLLVVGGTSQGLHSYKGEECGELRCVLLVGSSLDGCLGAVRSALLCPGVPAQRAGHLLSSHVDHVSGISMLAVGERGWGLGQPQPGLCSPGLGWATLLGAQGA